MVTKLYTYRAEHFLVHPGNEHGLSSGDVLIRDKFGRIAHISPSSRGYDNSYVIRLDYTGSNSWLAYNPEEAIQTACYQLMEFRKTIDTQKLHDDLLMYITSLPNAEKLGLG